ncbi:hypothetical protein MRB53_025465 [Persea americana]|uniref:Uncharacterized protein n=1 Tax=Persea americana TaxID=3435 RepID=A0ACC2LGG1_PERAE|nr:hypothetical protein MRB53_025465 [Persea americana]
MLILVLGCSVISLTLFIPPCRLFTLFVTKLQSIQRTVASLRTAYPRAWAWLRSIPSASFSVRLPNNIGNFYLVSYIT